MKKIIIGTICVFAILVLLVISGCSSSANTTTNNTQSSATGGIQTTTSSSVEAKTFNIAIITPLTGAAANVAKNYERGVEMAITDQNAKGGISIAGQKYKLNAIVRDDKFDPATGKSLANEVIFNDNVKVIFGPSQVEGAAMQDLTNQNKVLMFSMSPNPDMTNPKLPYNFFVGGIPQQMYSTVLNYVKKYYPDAKKMVTFYANLPDAQTWTAAAKQMAQVDGFDWLGYEQFPMGTSDFSPFAQKLMAYNPDIIDLSGGGGATGSLLGTIVTQIRQAGYNGIIIMPTVPPRGIMSTVPKQYLNKIVTNDVNIDSPIVTTVYRDLFNRYNQKYNEWPINLMPIAYNAASAFFQFLNGQKTMDTQQWIQDFSNYTWQGVFGLPAKWIGQPMFGINRALIVNYWCSEWKDGTLESNYTYQGSNALWESQ